MHPPACSTDLSLDQCAGDVPLEFNIPVSEGVERGPATT